MSLFSHGHLWQQEELADVDIRLEYFDTDSSDRMDDSPSLIRVLPGHSAILSSSPYCHAQVASEDTVLYTAQAYVDKLAGRQNRQHARRALAPLIRCPRISLFWLSASVSSPTSELLLDPSTEFSTQLKKLHMMRQANPTTPVPAGALTAELPNAPASWMLGPRTHKALSSGVRLQWSVPVDDIKAALQSSTASRSCVKLSSSQVTPPLAGIRFYLSIHCVWDDVARGSTLGIFAMPDRLPADTFYQLSAKIQCDLPAGPQKCEMSQVLVASSSGRGWRDFFGTRAMPGGWDEAAWVAKGLPTSGELVVNLCVTGVNGCHVAA